MNCKDCLKEFSQKRYKRHLELKCIHCNKCFTTITKLNRHLNAKTKCTETKMYKCEICNETEFYRIRNGKKILDKELYKRHLKRHTKESKVENYDGYKIQTTYTGSRYKITNNGNKNLLCSYISEDNKYCNTSAQLDHYCIKHYKGEKKPKIYLCKFIDEKGNKCEKRTKEAGLCINHGAKPTKYICNFINEETGEICGKCALTNHLCPIHNGEKRIRKKSRTR